MNTYRMVPFVTAVARDLTAATLQAVLGEATVTIQQEPCARAEITVHTRRETHEEALDDINTALGELGWQIADAVVQEWLDKAAQSLFLAAAGAAGGSRVADEFGVLGALAGLAAGMVAPPLIRAAEYHATRTTCGWQLQHVGGLALRRRQQFA